MIRLNTPFISNKLNLSNRLVMPPMATRKASEEGLVTDEILDYYDEKTRGGFLSLVIVEHSYVNFQGRARNRQISIADDSKIEGLKRIADCVHANKVKVAAQINHAGGLGADSSRVAPSAIPYPDVFGVPAAMTKEQIEQVTEDFKSAAVRVREASFDAVEIHSAHGYLLNQFYSPLTNHRQDEYGGSLANRIRLHLEIVQAVRAAVGEDFPILLRLGGCDYQAGGSTIADSVFAAREFAAAGVDIIDISGGLCRYTNPLSLEPGYFADMSVPIKQAVNIPVLLAGGVTTAGEANELLGRGVCDLIGVGRAIFNDSSWPAKAMASLIKGNPGQPG